MMKRRTVRIEKGDHMLRIFKSYEGDVICVYRHEFDQELTEIMGKPFYQVRGRETDYYETKGKFGYTLKEVVADHS